jgi:OmpA-OmpF porin, OOP family
MLDKANPGRVARAMVRQQGPKPCPTIGKSQVGSVIEIGSAVFVDSNDYIAYGELPDWPCTACSLNGQSDAEMFGCKHKLACSGATLAPGGVIHYFPVRGAGSIGIFREGLKMAAFDKLIQEIDSRYCLGPDAYPLVQETLGLIKRQPGGIGAFLHRFKAAGFAVEVASWLVGPDPVPLSGQEVEQTLGSDVICAIANKIGVSHHFARTILGYAIPKIIVLQAQGGAIPPAIPAWAASFRDSAIRSSTSIHEIMQHRAEQIRPSQTEHSGAAAGLKPLLMPGVALLITLGLLLGYFIGAGNRGVIQSAPAVVQNAPVAPPHVPSIPARLALHNENGLIAYSGTVGDDVARSSITDSLKTVFGAQNITGDLSVDLNAGPAHWAKGFKAALDNFKIPGSQALFEGNAVSVGGAIPEADRDGIMSSLKSVLGPQFAFATITGSSANETPTASSALTSGSSLENPIGAPNQPTLNPTIYFATNSAEVPSDAKVLVQQAAGLMKQLPAGTTVRISGYTDSVGTRAANMRLSQRRANAVRQLLVDAGVNPTMLSAKGYGSSHSLASKNGTTEGRSISTIEERLRKDRRVELSVAQ